MRHHFVPRFLLARWAETSADSQFEEFRLDLAGYPSTRRFPKATGYQHDLYALTRATVAGMDQQALETILLKSIDNAASKVRNKMAGKGLASLNGDERSQWVRFLTSLRFRQPDIVSKIKIEGAAHIHRAMESSTEEYEQLRERDHPASLREWVEQVYPGLVENFGMGIFKDLIINEEACEKLFRLRWWLYDFARGKYDLLLSDNALIWASGLDATHFALVLPIAPRLAFLATRSDETAQLIRAHTPTTLAVRLNFASVLQTRARLYARTDRPRVFIEKCLAQKAMRRSGTR